MSNGDSENKKIPLNRKEKETTADYSVILAHFCLWSKVHSLAC